MSKVREGYSRKIEMSLVFQYTKRDKPFSRGVIFTRARVLLALLSLRKNGNYL